MKRRHKEGQRSIQSYFEQQAKRVASASGEGQAIDENADAPDLQAKSACNEQRRGRNPQRSCKATVVGSCWIIQNLLQ